MQPFTTSVRAWLRAMALDALMRISPVSPYTTAITGIQSAMNRFDASARRTAEAPLDNLAEETVERIGAKVELQANAAVLRTADEMTGTLLDILA